MSHPNVRALLAAPGQHAQLAGHTLHHDSLDAAHQWVIDALRQDYHARLDLDLLEDVLATSEEERLALVRARLDIDTFNAQYWLRYTPYALIQAWRAASRADTDGRVETWDSRFDLTSYFRSAIAG
ncbi:hypothetical protein [Actinomyces faecalis]|uniref:hypothetical protein n=1 Tax=Actinomyces faecalis TaxID=2722820 RepID=UPI001554472C|nr:hypothetical protein [Actinomyces faecalis]